MLLKNYSSGFLSANINSSATTITVSPGHSLPTAVGGVFTAIIWNSTGYASPSQDPNAEIVWGQYSSPNTYTISRGQEGTPPVAHSAGALMGLYITAGVLSLPYIQVSEQEMSNTPGGTSIGTTWSTRVLNTINTDTNNLLNGVLNSNEVILPPGTYYCEASAPFHEASAVQLRLQTTLGVTLLTGQNAYDAGGGPGCNPTLAGQFTITATTTVVLQYYATNAKSADGLGIAINSGSIEVYAMMEFTMVNT